MTTCSKTIHLKTGGTITLVAAWNPELSQQDFDFIQDVMDRLLSYEQPKHTVSLTADVDSLRPFAPDAVRKCDEAQPKEEPAQASREASAG